MQRIEEQKNKETNEISKIQLETTVNSHNFLNNKKNKKLKEKINDERRIYRLKIF